MYIRRIKIRNVRGFDEVDLDFSRPDGDLSGWTVLAGRNGSGKSTLLKAIALAVAGPEAARVLSTSFADWIKVGQEEAEVRVQLEFSSTDRLGHLDLVAGWTRLRWERATTEREPVLSGNIPIKLDHRSAEEDQRDFDGIFVYDLNDSEEVEEIAGTLESLFGLRLWLEHRDLQPGRKRITALEEVAARVPAMAVFIGRQGADFYYTSKITPVHKKIIEDFSKLSGRLIPVFLSSVEEFVFPTILTGLGHVDFRKDKDPIQRLLWGITGRQDFNQPDDDLPYRKESEGWFLCAYGPYRRLTGHAADAQRLMAGPETISRMVSLFREDSSLIECVEWLREIYLHKLEGKTGAAETEALVLAFLNDGLLPDEVKVERVDSDGLWVTQRGAQIPLSELSDGYRTTAALVMDIVRHLHQRSANLRVELASDADGSYQRILDEGVVLIDEVDLHLHIEWQKRFGFWLKRHFPNIQFIVSTHSPFICQAADPRGLIRLPAPGEGRPAAHVSEDLYNTVVHGSADDAVLTELFGLETPYSEAAEKLREEVARLESKLQTGKATSREKEELRELRSKLPQSLNADVEQALRKLAAEG